MKLSGKLLAGLWIMTVYCSGGVLWADEVCTTTLDPEGKVIEQSCTESESSENENESDEAIISGPGGVVVTRDSSTEGGSCQLTGFNPGNPTAPYEFECQDQSGRRFQFKCSDPTGEFCTQEGETEFEVAVI